MLFTTEDLVRQREKNAFLCLTIAATTFLALCCACGGGSNGPTGPTNLSSAQARAAAVQIEQTFVAASAQMGAEFCGNPYDPLQQYPCTIPIAASVECNGGGTVAVAGSNFGELDYYNTGNATGTLTYVPTNCSIPGSTLTMNANPGLTFTSAMFYFYGGVSNLAVTETGPIKYGPKPDGVCQTNLTIAASFEGNNQHTLLSCTLSGTACGQTINQSCM
jgi:hypothetical protein